MNTNYYQIMQGDCLDRLREQEDNSIDSIVTDPPYGLGFMGKKWDVGVPAVDVFVECLRVLKPGGHLLAFGGSRTYHRLAVAVEDAGFDIRDQIQWVYGSGFPKSANVSKMIDKAAGELGVQSQGANYAGGDYAPRDKSMRSDYGYKYAPATEAARQWDGWGTALKPAHEPIVMARKPFKSRSINVLYMVESQLRERGVTGDIEWKPESVSGAARSNKATDSGLTRPLEPLATSAKSAAERETMSGAQPSLKNSAPTTQSGANQVASTSANTASESGKSCGTKCFQHTAESAPAAASESPTFSLSTTSTVAEQSTAEPCTERSTNSSGARGSLTDTECFAGIVTGLTGSMAHVHIKRDSAGHYLWPNSLPKHVPSKPLTVAANVLEHGTGALNIDGCRVDAIDGNSTARKPSLVNDTSAPFGKGAAMGGNGSPQGRWPANLIHDGSDEATAVMGAASRYFYQAKASRKDRNEGLDDMPTLSGGEATDRKDGSKNAHPTVKPTDLMRYLCRLVTPPGGTVLDPFMGSGSTGKAAILEGFNFIGIELDPDYLEIARKRIDSVI